MRKALGENGSRLLKLEGYQGSDGSVKNSIVYCLKGREDYLKVVKDSVEAFENGLMVRPDHIQEEVWKKAVASRLKSWYGVLDPNGETSGRVDKVQYDGEPFATHPDKPDSVYVKGLLELDCQIVQEATNPTRQTPHAQAVAEFESQSPLGTYVPMLRFTEEKVGNIETPENDPNSCGEFFMRFGSSSGLKV